MEGCYLAGMSFMLGISKTRAAGVMAALMVGISTQFGNSAEGWLVDFEKAKAQAEKEGKSILMEFTGSDWCPPCKALAENVLTKDIFKNEVPKNFVLLKLDNPRDKSHQSQEEQDQYKTLSKEYGIQGVPTVFLTDAKGKPYWQEVGYPGTPAEAYVSNLKNMAEGFKKRLTAFKNAEDAEGLEKAKLLDQGIMAMGEEIDPELNKEQIAAIVSLDSDNKAGLKEKYEAVARKASLEKKLQEVMQTASGPDDALEKLGAFIDEDKPTGAMLQEVLFMKGSVYFQMEKKSEAKEALLEAQKVAPDSEMGQRINTIIQRFFSEETEDEEK